MGNPTERENAPEPHTPAGAGQPPGGAQDEAPYVPQVKAYERPEVGRRGSSPEPSTADSTMVLPVVVATVPAPAPAPTAGPTPPAPTAGPTPRAAGSPAAGPAAAPQRSSVLGAQPASSPFAPRPTAAPSAGARPGASPFAPRPAGAPPATAQPPTAQPPTAHPSAAGPRPDAAAQSAAAPSGRPTFAPTPQPVPPPPLTPSGGAPAPASGGSDDGSGSRWGVLGSLVGDGQPSRAPRALLWTGVGVVVVAGLYVGAQWLFADKVPSGTQVAGVDVGGVTRDQAAARLEHGLAARAKEPIEITAGKASTTLDPADAGLSLDADATVARLAGFSLSPARLWEHLFGGDDAAPVIHVDQAKLDGAVDGLVDGLTTAPVDGTVVFADGKAVATKAHDGARVEPAVAAEALRTRWLVDAGPFELPTKAVAPDVTQEETDAALAQAKKIVSAPVVVEVGDQHPELPAAALADAVSFSASKGALAPAFDGGKLVDAVVERTNDLLTTPDDAHFEFVGGKPTVVGGRAGTTLDPKALAAAVKKAALGEDRTAAVELVQQDPEDSRAALEKLGVKQVISSFDTPLTNEHIRTQNLIRGAQLLTGTLVKPGETFSLIDSLSPITVANGYFAAGVISNGVHTEGVGGGLSQMATTTYNAGFFAGYTDVQHRQHSYWFNRYPPGREATIYVGSLDMKFKNDTPYGAVMQAWVGGGRLHVQIWSTPYYTVKSSVGDKRNVVPATIVHKSGPDCENYPKGNDGFRITNYRKVYKGSSLVKDESYTWTYKPDNGIVCGAGGSGGPPPEKEG